MLILLITPIKVKAEVTNDVVDKMGYLTQEQIDDLQSDIDNIITTYQIEPVILIIGSADGKSSMEYADDYYDYYDYGVGSDESGLLLLVNMEAREIWISTKGNAIDVFDDSRIQTIVGNIKSNLSNEQYYEACKRFLNDVSYYENQGVASNHTRVDRVVTIQDTTYIGRVLKMIKTWPVYIIALLISLIATGIITASNKGRVTTSNLTYEEKDSFKLTDSMDQYLRETTHRIKIEKNSGSSSSTHTSSSGSTHGGGGGKF